MTPAEQIQQLKDGVVSIVTHAPKQIWRTLRMQATQQAIANSLGDTMNYVPYYFGNPQLFRMPAMFREPGPALAPTSIGAFEQDSLKKALPFIALGIAGIVAFNIYKGR